MLKPIKPLLQTISIDELTAKQIYNLIQGLIIKHEIFFVDSNNSYWVIDHIDENKEINCYKKGNKGYTEIDLFNPGHIKQFKAIGYYI